MVKFLRNLLKESILSLFNIANIIFPLGSLFDFKMPLVNFFLDTRSFSNWYFAHDSVRASYADTMELRNEKDNNSATITPAHFGLEWL